MASLSEFNLSGIFFLSRLVATYGGKDPALALIYFQVEMYFVCRFVNNLLETTQQLVCQTCAQDDSETHENLSV